MVGVQTSNRCDNCRKRKKKCGEQRPSCAECIRSGWKCPGYKARWKFVDESPRLAQHFAKKKYVYDVTNLGNREPDDHSLGTNIIAFGSSIAFRNARRKVPRFHGTNPLATALVHSLGSKVQGSLMPLWDYGSFFQYIPSRLGYNIALDDAVACICKLYSSPSSTDLVIKKSIYQKYVKALNSLQKCIEDESACMQAETLCASILLQMCELGVNNDRGKWGDLVGGTIQLVRARGAARYTNQFDHGMLMSQMPHIFVLSVASDEPCYLNEPEWRKSLVTTPPAPFPNNSLSQEELLCHKLLDYLCGLLAEIPNVFVELCTMRYSNHGLTSEPRIRLLNKAVGINNAIKEFLRTEVEPRWLVPSSEGREPTTKFPSILAATVDCTAFNAMLTVHQTICFLRHGKFPEPILQRSFISTRDCCEDPDVMQHWTRRALDGLAFIDRQSSIAAKRISYGSVVCNGQFRLAPQQW